MENISLSETVLIIGLAGPMGSGKTTLAGYLERNWRCTKRFSFATGIRRIMSLVYGFSEEQLMDGKFKSTPHAALGGNTPRYALQVIGTEGFRAANPDTWVNYTMREIREAVQTPRATTLHVVVIDDVRFPNEVKAIKDAGGVLVYINRLPDVNTKQNPVPATEGYEQWYRRLLSGFRQRLNGRAFGAKPHASEANFTLILEQADLVIESPARWGAENDMEFSRSDAECKETQLASFARKLQIFL